MNDLKPPIISAIVAMAQNRVIGINNQLPWRLPADLRHFKALTSGHPILMGRKTYQSIGRPLPNRTNIIMTRDPHLVVPGCLVVTSIDQAIQVASKEHSEEIFIIGGAEIYAQCMPRIQRLYLTIIHHEFAGDAVFPPLDAHAWKEMERVAHAADAENAYAYSFVRMERI